MVDVKIKNPKQHNLLLFSFMASQMPKQIRRAAVLFMEEPFKEFMDELFWDGFSEELYETDLERYRFEFNLFLRTYS